MSVTTRLDSGQGGCFSVRIGDSIAIVIDHPNAKTVQTTPDVQGNIMFTVVVVGTDLALNMGDPRYDAVKVNGLALASTQSLDDQNFAADMVRLVELDP